MVKNSKNKTFKFDEEENWVGFWNLLLQEDIKQNPNLYKKNKNANSNCVSNPNSKNAQEEKQKQNENNKKENP
jgi:hypothetical protein